MCFSSVHVCVCKCLCACLYIHMCACLERPGVGIGCLTGSLPYALRQVPHLSIEVTHLANLRSQLAPEVLLLCQDWALHPWAVIYVDSKTPNSLRSSSLLNKHYLPNHLSSPIFLNLLPIVLRNNFAKLLVQYEFKFIFFSS